LIIAIFDRMKVSSIEDQIVRKYPQERAMSVINLTMKEMNFERSPGNPSPASMGLNPGSCPN